MVLAVSCEVLLCERVLDCLLCQAAQRLQDRSNDGHLDYAGADIQTLPPPRALRRSTLIRAKRHRLPMPPIMDLHPIAAMVAHQQSTQQGGPVAGGITSRTAVGLHA